MASAACGVDHNITPLLVQATIRRPVLSSALRADCARRGIGKMNPNAGEQFIKRDGLGDKVNAAAFHRAHHMFGIVLTGHEDHRHIGKFFFRFQDLAGFKTHPFPA